MSTITDAATELAATGRGFAEPAESSQQVFRALLDAMARPGRVHTLPPAAVQGMEPPVTARGLAASLLCLLDAETRVWLHPAWPVHQLGAYLRFHTGAPIQLEAAHADFVVVDGRQAEVGFLPGLWTQLDAGIDEAPQASATLVIELPVLSEQDPGRPAQHLLLRGPGIAHSQGLHLGGLGPDFWQARAALGPAYPCGIDLILCCGDAIAALPRTTRVSLEA